MDELIRGYPTLVVAIFLGLNALLTFLWATLKWFVKREFLKMEEHQTKQDKDIGDLKKDMAGYKTSFAVSQRSFDDLVGKIDGHVKKEEKLPEKIELIQKDVAEIKGMLRRNGSK